MVDSLAGKFNAMVFTAPYLHKIMTSMYVDTRLANFRGHHRKFVLTLPGNDGGGGGGGGEHGGYYCK